jgi:hypothetical protein
MKPLAPERMFQVLAHRASAPCDALYSYQLCERCAGPASGPRTRSTIILELMSMSIGYSCPTPT